MFELVDRGEKKQGKLGVGNVLVLLNLHGCYQQEGINQWKTKTMQLINPSRNLTADQDQL